ncbi:hypothetical protein A2291_05710 [candidate division WOR-1 bacterium RIFOXYB2_FULL_42_35]|uniref:Kojibiose phosphorylase n=1 Tax=candidate division WOR-1 bacterium RIFOXYC2_FULL_41_25 TaxID=1802586 RepID=A0A1F4TQQ7_UNCSA|nr:MAG: hypothetical protein A2247_06030 [candidate division WOR-1 bacterium RIFOXYA2_FULL_41_14]OGC24946.1 MAG: hypothetical protein A2291_05710 [candidate division WOR-1 bacterium RIFOXYB2_FULL_42_35]OGC35064.1 MAG: hypothetical protein A2462_05835 [candidate division WOR-1 bacterium RIFOXYC2_FULL_41_25]
MSAKFNLSSDEWLIKEKGFIAKYQGKYESIFTLGNGYLGVRGSLEENPNHSHRGTFIAGVFDQAEGYVRELVKTPGWTDFCFWVGEHRFSVDSCKVLSHERILDLRKGILHRTTRLKGPQGRVVRLEIRRVVFTHQVRGAMLDATITPENFSGPIRVFSGLNGDVTNLGYFHQEKTKHLNLVKMERDKGLIYLEMENRDDKTRIALAAQTVFSNAPAKTFKVSRIYGEKLTQVFSFDAEKGKSYHFTKFISTYTSREGYERQLKSAAKDLVLDMVYEGLERQLKQHLEARNKLWEAAAITIKGDKKAQKGINFNLHHLLAAKPHHDPTVSIAAKLLTGEGYKGHVFWDTEIFILPFYIYTFPEDAKNLLMYRYYTLQGALQNAQDMGYQGAKFAWESADSGLETTPSYGVREDGSAVKIFTGEEEHHIVSDVIYGINNYFNATGDTKFLHEHGAEIIFSTAVFWMSRIEKRRDRYEIRKVIGPDEFHEHVDNNAFTNYLVMWNLLYAYDLYKKMKKSDPEGLAILLNKIKLKETDLERMKLIAKTIYLPYNQKTEIFEQFEGYFSLKDFTINQTDHHGMPLLPQGVDEMSLEKTQLLKQADVILLLYLFTDRFSQELKKKNYQYYEKRTMHKSSLSPCIYAIMGLEVGSHKRAYDYFIKTSYIDLDDFNRNAADGIHGAATGGAWMTIVHGFAGMRVRQGNLCFDPWLPKNWQELTFIINWQGSRIKVQIDRQAITFQLLDTKGKNIIVKVQDRPIQLDYKKSKKIKLKKQ